MFCGLTRMINFNIAEYGTHECFLDLIKIAKQPNGLLSDWFSERSSD